MIATGRLQKVSVSRTGRVLLEIYSGEKRWVVVDVGAAPVEVPERPALGDDADPSAPPPAIQGLLRKELVPSALTEATAARLVFTRPDEKVRVLILEKRRTVVGAVVDDGGVRVLAILGAPREGLKRGGLYCAPVVDEEAPATDRASAAAAPRILAPRDPHAELLLRGRAEQKRLKRLVGALERDLAKHGDPAALEERGEILKSVMGTVARGAAEVAATDWEGNPVVIPLDPALDAKGNLARLFHKAKKARVGVAHVKPRLDEARARLAALAQALAATTTTTTTTAAATLEALLRAEGTGGSARRRAATAGKRMPWRAFQVSDGVVVRVGRGAKDNDELRKSARGNDLWLHARDQRGAHVIVPEKAAADDAVVLDAAHLAAHFSAARGEPRVDVQHTRVKNLKKGPAAGLVLVSNESVLHLRVDEGRTRRLLAGEVAAS